jgi:hypothetical protein
MTIIIPMAGLSSRFTKAGYVLPKYMLYVKNRSLFNLAVTSFEKYFDTCRFVFVARNVFDTKTFIEKECELMGIKDFTVVILPQPTKGQAETVLEGIVRADVPDEEPILIFNIDTFRPGFAFPADMSGWDGYLEVFVGSGKNWSYAKTESDDSTLVVETAEKVEISRYCSTGLYYFSTASSFKTAYAQNLEHPCDGKAELYVAPLYNHLIRDGKKIHIHVIDRSDVIFSGVPDEYEQILQETINGKKVRQ